MAVQYYEGIGSIVVIGNYSPRQCGIATFTTDLVEALSTEVPAINCWAVAINDRTSGYAYPEKVRFEINQNEGAESSLAWLLSLMTIQKIYADVILKQSSSPPTDKCKG